jgi:PST family polysaccharide transporter
LRKWTGFRPIQLIHHQLVQNILSLYGVQFASYIVPLVTIPYLARVLGASGWGLVAFAQGFGSYVALIGEYGFALSATREIARYRDDREKLTKILAGVLGAEGVLVGISILVAAIAAWWIPIFRVHPQLFAGGMLLAAGQAFNMMWFFLGLENMRLVASLDVLAKALASACVFAFVHHPGQEWRVLFIQGSGFFLSGGICLGLAYRQVPARFPNWSSVKDALRMGWSMFVFRGSVSLYTAGNAFILGLFVAPQFVGYYAGGEKICQAFLRLLSPLNQTLFPRLSHLVLQARERAARLALISVSITGLGGAAMGAVAFLFAPALVRMILGLGFDPAIPILRVLALLPPLIALSNVFGVQWMLPLGMDRPFITIVLLAGLINVGLALVLAPRFAGMGMACAVVAAETFVTAAIYLLLRCRRLDPLSYHLGEEGKPV